MLWIVGLQTAISASSTGSSTLRRLAYLPKEHTDFTFSVSRDDFSILRLGISLLIVLLVVSYLRRRRRSAKVDSSDGSV